jgi:hypothetical protein
VNVLWEDAKNKHFSESKHLNGEGARELTFTRTHPPIIVHAGVDVKSRRHVHAREPPRTTVRVGRLYLRLLPRDLPMAGRWPGHSGRSEKQSDFCDGHLQTLRIVGSASRSFFVRFLTGEPRCSALSLIVPPVAARARRGPHAKHSQECLILLAIRDLKSDSKRKNMLSVLGAWRSLVVAVRRRCTASPKTTPSSGRSTRSSGPRPLRHPCRCGRTARRPTAARSSWCWAPRREPPPHRRLRSAAACCATPQPAAAVALTSAGRASGSRHKTRRPGRRRLPQPAPPPNRTRHLGRFPVAAATRVHLQSILRPLCN